MINQQNQVKMSSAQSVFAYNGAFRMVHDESLFGASTMGMRILDHLFDNVMNLKECFGAGHVFLQ